MSWLTTDPAEHILPVPEQGAVSYIPPFETLKAKANIYSERSELIIAFSYDDFLDLIKQLLRSVPVDETWYVERYSDVAHAVTAEKLASARRHFIEHGYFEGRLPGPLTVDEEWYLARYPDVAESVHAGVETSAQAHFDRHGYQEGRLPFQV